MPAAQSHTTVGQRLHALLPTNGAVGLGKGEAAVAQQDSDDGAQEHGAEAAMLDPERARGCAEPIRLSELPPMPRRGSGYWAEPFCGVTTVVVLSGMFIGIVHGIAAPPGKENNLHSIAVILVWSEAALALLCVGYLLFAGAGVIRRGEKTCYPMPPEVEERLRSHRSLDGLENLPGPEGSATLGSYCVRCCVWRPPKTAHNDVHHCNTCQRCVRGFDHHCGVFGRCIVRGNMPCFTVLICMLPAGFASAFMAMLSGAANGFG